MDWFRERCRRKTLTASCLVGLLGTGVYCGQGSRAAASRSERGRAEQLAAFIRRLDRPAAPEPQLRMALLDLYRRVITAEQLQDLRDECPEMELPKLSRERLALSYQHAAELARDAGATDHLKRIEGRYQAALAFTAAEEAAPEARFPAQPDQ